MQRIILTFLLLICSSSVFSQICAEMVFMGKFPVNKEPVTIICHKRYVAGYSIPRKAPLWVAEKLTYEQVNSFKTPRQNAFKYDPLINQNTQPQQKDFQNNDYDRGHMANFDNMSDNAAAALESFYMTNMVAQHYQNNRGIWKSLELKTREIAKANKIIFVITGPIFDDGRRLSDGTSIPTRLYKLILLPISRESYTFILPNTALSTSSLPTFLIRKSELKIQNKHTDVFPNRHKFTDKFSIQ